MEQQQQTTTATKTAESIDLRAREIVELLGALPLSVKDQDLAGRFGSTIAKTAAAMFANGGVRSQCENPPAVFAAAMTVTWRLSMSTVENGPTSALAPSPLTCAPSPETKCMCADCRASRRQRRINALKLAGLAMGCLMLGILIGGILKRIY